MRALIKAHPMVMILIALSILLRIGMYVCQKNAAGDDGNRYLYEARNLVEYQIFSSEDPIDGKPPATAHDLPLWPMIMAGYLWLTGSLKGMIYLAGLTNILLFSAGLLMMIYILRHRPFCSDAVGIGWAVLIVSFIPGSVVYSLFYMPEQLCVTMFLAAILFFFKGMYDSRKFLLVSALFWGLSVLSKPIAIPMSLAYFVILLFVLKDRVGKRFLYVGACLAIWAAVLTPWLIRNRMTFGVWDLTSISKSNLYVCNWRWMVNSWDKDKKNAALEKDRIFLAEMEKHDYNVMEEAAQVGLYAKDRLLEHIPDYLWFTVKNHPWLYAGTGIRAFYRYFGNRDLEKIKLVYPRNSFWDVVKPWLTTSIWGPVSVELLFFGYVIIFIGFCKRSRQLWKLPPEMEAEKRNWLRLSFACAMCTLILLAAVIGPVTATRYRFVMNPFFAMLASFIGSVTYAKKEPESRKQTEEAEGEKAATAEATQPESDAETANA